MKIVFTKFVLLISFFTLPLYQFGQSPIFNFGTSTKLYYNPAFTGTDENIVLGFNYLGLSNGKHPSNSTLLGTFKLPYVNNSYGLYVLNDNLANGAYNTFTANGIYSRRINTSFANIYVTLNVGLINNTLKSASISDRYDPNSEQKQPELSSKQSSFNLGTGILISNTKFYGGFAMNHINKPKEYENQKLPVRYTLIIGSELAFKDKKINPNLLIEYQNKRLFSDSINDYLLNNMRHISLSLDYSAKVLSFAIGYRYMFDAHSSLTAGLGLKINPNVGITYNLTITPYNNYSNNSNDFIGSHLISINLNLRKSQRRSTDRYHIVWSPRWLGGYSNITMSGNYNGTNNINNTNFLQDSQIDFNTEEYDRIYENPMMKVSNNPLSTFSIDVDNASYSNVRRFLNYNNWPPKDAVRIEEFINYFKYDYPLPENDKLVSVTTEYSDCPWNKSHKLLHIGLKAKELDATNLLPNNLVFLIDVSGSMQPANKLPLLKSAFKILVDNLKDEDRVAIVVYAGNTGLILPSTSGKNKVEILKSLQILTSRGSTAGGAGLQLAYKTANNYFIENGNNRIILATDGDFNIGPSSDAEMVRLIEKNRKSGIFITVLGFGMGNYKDSKMEKIADHGNGNYFYIDNLVEAKKVLVTELNGTIHTIAKDVKIQIEFNPTKVESYRLIGYENRVLRAEDFNDDKKDAGEIGSGSTVTALYEIVPVGSFDSNQSKTLPEIDELKYQRMIIKEEAINRAEIANLKIRYKKPDDTTSQLFTYLVPDNYISFENASNNIKFSSSVAQFGLLLRDSKHKGSANYENLLELTQQSIGGDTFGYRKEFLSLVEICKKKKEKH